MAKKEDGFKLEDDLVYSQLRKDLSVKTPSIVPTQKSRSKSYMNSKTSSNSYHMANPNPQGGKSFKYKGIRDLGYTRYAKEVNPDDIIKFGKKVFHGNSMMTNEQMMEFHLKQMRDKKNNKEAFIAEQYQQQMDFLNHMN